MKRASVLLVLFCWLSVAIAAQPGFDPKDVVRQVRTVRCHTLGAGPFASDGGEFLVDTSIIYCPATSVQLSPGAASDGTNFLVVWQDWRDGGDNYDIYGARVNQNGTVLDPCGIVISTAVHDQWSIPRVAFDGTNFLVVWHSVGICGARISQDGIVLDPSGLTISDTACDVGGPNVVSGGTSSLVVWTDARNGNSDIHGARISQAGAVLDPSGIAISTAAGGQYSPGIAFDGTNFLAVWTDERRSGDNPDIYGARVNQAGVVLEPTGIAVSTAAYSQYYPAIAFDGTNFLVVWVDERNSSYSDIYGARVSQAGVVLDTSGIGVGRAPLDQNEPAVAFDGSNSLVVWHDGRYGGDYEYIFGARVSPNGTVLDPAGIAVSVSANGHESPAIASDGTNFLAVWADGRGISPDIYGARVSEAGVVIDTSGVVISTAAHDQHVPAVSSDGTNFFAVWQDHRGGLDYNIYGARVSRDGAVLDPSGIAISTATGQERSPAVASDGSDFLVVWEDCRDSSGYDIYGARVSQAGTVLDTSGIAISAAADNQGSPAVAFDGANFLVVWQSTGIYGARVSPAGTVLDPSGIAISTGVRRQERPTVAFDGATSLVVWDDYRNGSNPGIFGARVSQAGVVLDTSGIAVCTVPYDQYPPAVAFDGANFLAVWQDFRSGCQYDIYGARVSEAGVVFDSGPVVRQQGSQQEPALCVGPGNQVFLAFQGWAGTAGARTYNTQRIWGNMNPVPGVEERENSEVRRVKGGATVVRGVLFLPEASSYKPQAASLLDISGRKVVELQPGANDVSYLPAGVYFVRKRSAVSRQPSPRSS